MLSESDYAVAVDEAVDRGKAEILEDVASGRVSSDVQTFGELHDFVDANEYGGLCDEPHPHGIKGEQWNSWGIDVQEILHQWIVAGGITSTLNYTEV